MHCQGSASALRSDEQAHLSNLLLKLSFYIAVYTLKTGVFLVRNCLIDVKNAIKNIVKDLILNNF